LKNKFIVNNEKQYGRNITPIIEVTAAYTRGPCYRHAVTEHWFSPHFTGLQNTFMAAQLAGMASEDIAGLMP
jgi:hypothetical protein